MTPCKSMTEDRTYSLDPPSILWRGLWYPAHLVAGRFGSALIPDDDRLPIMATVWVEYVPDKES